MVSEWQKNYENEAKEIIRDSVKEYEFMVHMSNIVAQKLCEVGNHHTERKLRFCKFCKRSFCSEHGDIKKGICDSCLEIHGDY